MQLSIHRPKEALRHSVSLWHTCIPLNHPKKTYTGSCWTLMTIACPLMNLEGQDVTSDMNLNHRHAYTTAISQQKSLTSHTGLWFTKTMEDSLRDVNNCVSTHTKNNRKCSFTLISFVNCEHSRRSLRVWKRKQEREGDRGCMHFIVTGTFICGTCL